MDQVRNIVVFGATGKIGQNLLQYICENQEPFHVIAVGRKDKNESIPIGMEYCQADICRTDTLSGLPTDNIYAVVDLAGAVVSSTADDDYCKYVSANVLGTVNVLEYARKVGAERIIYTHTYNDALRNLHGTNEILPVRYFNTDLSSTFSMYTITKNCAVDILENAASRTKIKVFILRLPNIYMYLKDPYYTLAGKRQIRPFHKMIIQAQNSEDIEIWGDPNHFMDMVYVKDCCQMIVCALKADCDGGLFNVGTGVKTTLLEQVQAIIDVFSPPDRKSNIIYCPEKQSGPDFVMNIQNAVEKMGYNPQYGFRKMLEEIKNLSSK